jgi:hypothetical protein
MDTRSLYRQDYEAQMRGFRVDDEVVTTPPPPAAEVDIDSVPGHPSGPCEIATTVDSE